MSQEEWERKGLILLLCILGIGLLEIPSGCSRKSTDGEIIKVVGSSTVLPIASKAAERFKEIRGNVRITVSPGGSGVGITSVGSGLADIGMISREITDEERKNYRYVNFRQVAIGRDAVACAVSSEIYEAGVKTLSRGQIRRIYSGEISDWRQVGGPDKEIFSIDKEFHRGTRHVFMGYIFGDPNAEAEGVDLVSGSNNEEQTKIAMSDTAIGMLSIAWLNEEVKGVGIEENEKIIQPSIENVKNGSYPISRDLSLITNGEPTGLVREYIDFILSPEGQKIIEESGYVPIR